MTSTISEQNIQQATFDILTSRIGRKVTIFRLGEMGFPSCIQCHIEKIERKNYAQYRNLIHIQCRPKGKRYSYVLRIYNDTSIMFYDNFVDLQANMFTDSISNGTMVLQSLQCFDNKYFEIAKGSTSSTPFLEIIKD